MSRGAREGDGALNARRAGAWFDGTFWGLVAFAVGGVSLHLVRPTVSYRALELGGNAFDVGVVAASYAIVAVFLAIPLGRAVDRGSPRKAFLIGILVMAGGAATSATAPSIAVLALGQILTGAGWVSAAIGYQAFTAKQRGVNRDRAFARLAVAASTGQFLGPILAGVILNLEVGPSPTASALGFAALVALPAWWLGLRTVAPPSSHATSEKAGEGEPAAPIGRIIRRAGVPQALLMGITVMSSIDLMIAYLPVIGEVRGVGPGTVGLLLSLRAAAGLASRLNLARMMLHLGRRRLLFASIAGAGIAMGGIAVVGSAWLLAPIMIAIGYGLGVGTPMTMAWLSTQTPREDRGTALALRMAGNRGSQVVVPVAFGSLATAVGPGSVFAVMSIALLLCSGLLRRAPISDDPSSAA